MKESPAKKRQLAMAESVMNRSRVLRQGTMVWPMPETRLRLLYNKKRTAVGCHVLSALHSICQCFWLFPAATTASPIEAPSLVGPMSHWAPGSVRHSSAGIQSWVLDCCPAIAC